VIAELTKLARREKYFSREFFANLTHPSFTARLARIKNPREMPLSAIMLVSIISIMQLGFLLCLLPMALVAPGLAVLLFSIILSFFIIPELVFALVAVIALVASIWCFLQLLAPLFYLAIEINTRAERKVKVLWTILISIPIVALCALSYWAVVDTSQLPPVKESYEFSNTLAQYGHHLGILLVLWMAAIGSVSLFAISLAWLAPWIDEAIASSISKRRSLVLPLCCVLPVILFGGGASIAAGARTSFVIVAIISSLTCFLIWLALRKEGVEQVSSRGKVFQVSHDAKVEALLFGEDIAFIRFLAVLIRAPEESGWRE
jgi:hypothetical protein